MFLAHFQDSHKNYVILYYLYYTCLSCVIQELNTKEDGNDIMLLRRVRCFNTRVLI